MTFDPRTTLIRDNRASTALEGIVPAASYVEPRTRRLTAPSAAIRREARATAEQMDQLLFGEVFDVLEERDGWAFGQARRDGYVGFVETDALTADLTDPTHAVSALRTYAFCEPNIKSAPVGLYSMNSLIAVEQREGRFAKGQGTGWFIEAHLTPIGFGDADHAEVAERFLGAPYQWGGRESLGLDCSGLVQQALYACARACPRDSDQQALLGHAVEPGALQRGDLVFWKGHVAIVTGENAIIHANAHHMMTAREALDAAIARIRAAGAGDPTAFRRP
ncbi:MAG TPA: NlpC/P60 family protein [Caulobacteraceae bacterium]